MFKNVLIVLGAILLGLVLFLALRTKNELFNKLGSPLTIDDIYYGQFIRIRDIQKIDAVTITSVENIDQWSMKAEKARLFCLNDVEVGKTYFATQEPFSTKTNGTLDGLKIVLKEFPPPME